MRVNMTKQQKYTLFLTIGCFIAALCFDYYLSRSSKLDKYAVQIEEALHNQEVAVRQFFDNKNFIHRQLAKDKVVAPQQQLADYEYIRQLAGQDFTVLLYQGDNLVFWNNQYASPPSDILDNISPTAQQQFVDGNNGYYLLKSQKYISKSHGPYSLVAMFPIKYNYSIESDYLSDRFVANKHFPDNIDISVSETNYPILTRRGDLVCYLEASGLLFDRQQQRRLLTIYLLGFLLLTLFINASAKNMIAQGKPIVGAGVFIVAVFGVRLLTILFNFSERFSELPVFAQTFQSNLISSSLGDLLINIILLLWIMFFFHKEFPSRRFDHLSKRSKFGLTFTSYLCVLTGVLVLSWVFKSLIFNKNIKFDFNNTLAQTDSGMLAILGIILLLLALFLFSHKMMLTIANINLPRKQRFTALAFAILTLAPIISLLNFMLPVVYLLLIASVFVLLFDLFIDSTSMSFSWLVIWLVILSAFPSMLLFKYNAYQDRILRSGYAEKLAQLRDKTAEPALLELADKLMADTAFKSLFPPYGFQADKKAIDQKIEKYFYEKNYLTYNYDFLVNAYNKDTIPIFNETKESFQSFQQYFSEAIPTNHANLRLLVDQQANHINYLVNVALPSKHRYDHPVHLALRFNRQRREQSRVYTELLVDRPFKNLPNLDNYEYAIYKNNVKIDGEGDSYGNIYNFSRTPEKGNTISIEAQGRSEIIHASMNDIKVVIGKEVEQYTSLVSFFSYIFGALVAFIILTALINKFYNFLPDTLRFSLFLQQPSLKNRIQFFILSLIITSFLIIGLVTVWFFRNSHHEYHENRLKRKAESVLKDSEHELKLMYASNDTLINIGKLIDPVARIHRIDINMYDLNGFLIASSEKDIFRQGVMEGRISAPALYALSRQNLNESRQVDEHIGDLYYNAAYLALKDPTGKTVTYLGLPYYSKQRALRSDVSVFMSTLLNVYVFLLLIAGAIAIFVADTITRPLVQIGEKMKEIKLGKRNEPLRWESKDEIGALVAEFNKMTRELENNAIQLEQTAQEGAWREMAKQVAHEIKNPLTPMKLSIQYLQHAYQSNPDDIEPLLRRVANTLIEQIDNLASIAAEFSTFAKMPRAENQRTLLNTLVASVFDLFSKESSETMELVLTQPKEQFYVFADKNHLMRVLNNLIKNAIQAIPDQRKGLIQVSLYRVDDTAIVKVADNGTGISDDKKDKVFVPNFTTKNSGTGLGLAISKNIIESVNGRIWFDTTPNVGTDFYIELPLVEINEMEEVG